MIRLTLAALSLLWAAGPGWAGSGDPATAPLLGAATDFGQTWSAPLMAALRRLSPGAIRDEIFWTNVETAGGGFVFDTPLTTYPDRLPPETELVFLVNNPHPLHDGGTTPHDDAGRRAFARYAAATLRRFPRIATVEIGNEMNSATFAWGPGWEGDLATRADSYVRLLAATATAVRAARPDARIIGGAAHSIPIAWLREIFARGAAGSMDALAIHPYTVRPEQLARQIRLLRAMVPQTATMPIAVTEFGQTDAGTAPAYLLKSYCQQAISGVARSIWYPLNPRGDGLAPLLTPEGGLTATGATFRFLKAHFEGRPVEPFAPDPFTYGCRFGTEWLMIWGETRDVTLAGDVRAVDPVSGTPHGANAFTLSPDMPLVLAAPSGQMRLGQEVRLGASGLVADSWHQFAYPGTEGAADPFAHLVRRRGQEAPLVTRPGQERDGVPWTPYLGTDIDGEARAAAEWVRPAGSPADPVEIVWRYRAPVARVLRPELRLAPWDGGATLRVALNGARLYAIGNIETADIALDPIPMAAGDVLDVIVGPNGSGGGTDLRVILRDGAD